MYMFWPFNSLIDPSCTQRCVFLHLPRDIKPDNNLFVPVRSALVAALPGCIPSALPQCVYHPLCRVDFVHLCIDTSVEYTHV